MNKLIEQLKRHEGFKAKPYLCTAGKITIGYGRNLDDVGVSKAEAEAMLIDDVASAKRGALALFLSYEQLSDARKAVVVNMCFNLGRARLSGFKNMIAAVNDGYFDLAAKEMLNSKWAKQVGNRAIELSEQMRTGDYL
jgi:lysozyme